MTDELSEYEQALRTLPLPYSLALRLRDAGVVTEVVCEYVGVEAAALKGIYRIAEAKLAAAQQVTTIRAESAGQQPRGDAVLGGGPNRGGE